MSKVACVVISLLLGIIIGLAAVVGGVFLVLSINVDTLLGWVGLEDDNKNEDGSYVYIAGDQSLLKTINDTIDFFSNLDTSTLAGLNDFLPAVGLAVDSIADSLKDGTGIELDVDGLMETPINDLGDWLNDWVREIQLYPVVETLLPSYLEGDD
ncbi:MAG: hypothetical protein LUD47_03440, partial [Clostridia bacterium]|nr:hypothetical protein [Clostridia bacterium]